MNVLDLFSGIGGFSLGLERAGMRTIAFCECDEFCRRVLRKHWPAVPVYGDVRELTARALADAAELPRNGGEYNGRGYCESEDGGAPSKSRNSCGIDVICGGFPCQDISVAGKGAGIEGERSGLWSQFARIIGEVRPRYVIVENVAALLHRGLGRVLGDLAALGFDAEWHCIPASAIGAPHRRDRIWIVAYADDPQRGAQHSSCDNHGTNGHAQWQESPDRSESSRETLANANGARLEGWTQSATARPTLTWEFEPDVGRVAHGVPARVDRLRALGNAIVPQIAEIIGRAIMAAENEGLPF